MTLPLWIAPVVSATAAAAEACGNSQLATPPAKTTFVVDPSDSSKGIVVTKACNETTFALDASSTANEAAMTVASMNIADVVSYPKVQRL